MFVGCGPVEMIVTDVDYEDPNSKPNDDPVIDNDEDGFEASEDCDDNDPDVFPDAPERCNGIDDDCDGDKDEEDTCPCETIDEAGAIYSFCEEPLDGEAAFTLCRNAGMELVKIDDEDEQIVLIDLLSEFGDGSWLIGLNDRDVEGEWRWSDGSELEWSNWNSGEPNDWGEGEDCVELRPNQENWNDTPCDSSRPFICEAF